MPNTINEATFLKATSLICGTVIVGIALLVGHNSNLATLTIIALWGGEKLLEKIGAKKNESG